MAHNNLIDQCGSGASSAVSTNKKKKVRVTDNLFCFNETQNENLDNGSTPQMHKKSLRSSSVRIREQLDTPRKQETKPNQLNSAKLNISIACQAKQMEKINEVNERKIIKAKRCLKSKPKKDEPTVELRKPEIIEIDSDETVTSDENGFLDQTLPSPISPSRKSSENPSLIYLRFRTSKENLHPSTKGEVSSKRRTYELEDSVNDISLLKSMSERDSVRINSKSDSKKKSCSKVTLRRKWEKVLPSPTFDAKTPSWLTPDKTPGVSPELKKSFVSKVKVPNFALIHQKALAKVESIDEYKERKEKRAKMLLTGQKPLIETTNRPEGGKKVRKDLRFAANSTPKEKSPTYIPLPTTPMPKYVPPIEDEAFVPIPMTPPSVPKVASANFKFRCQKEKVMKFEMGLRKVVAKNELKFGVDKLKSKPAVKSVISKSKPEVNLQAARRCAIKGVRSNRRFELLMNMRKGK